MSTTSQETLAPSELVVIINPLNIQMTEYLGSRATLEAEGVIPANIEWQSGFNSTYWRDENFYYELRRQRPTGAKGPRKQFLECDWWCLNWRPLVEDRDRNRLAIKFKEVEEELFRQSEPGKARFERWCDAKKDRDYQAFRQQIPGLENPRHSRAKSVAQGVQA